MLIRNLINFTVILFGATVSSGAYAEAESKYKLESVKISDVDPDSVLKLYSVKGPVKVEYEYRADEMGEYEYALGMKILNGSGELIPIDLKDAYLYAGGDGDKTVKSLGITNPPKNDCHYAGKAVINISKIAMVMPEFPTEFHSDVLISKVISSTTPALKCE